MAERRWITRDEIADIYDARADRAQESAMNGGGPDDYMYVAKKLTEEAILRDRAEQIRAIDRLSRPLGDRVA